MTRFFYSPQQVQDETTVALEGEDAHHLQRVLRASVGDTVELCGGNGSCRQGEIVSLEKARVLCRLGGILPDSEPAVRFTLAFGLLKGEKNEFILQKATELGVSGFIPFISSRTVARPEKNMVSRRERWQKIIRGAAAQSRRSILPDIQLPCSWQELLQQSQRFEQAVLFWEGEGERPLRKALSQPMPGERILLVTGPEGGFSSEEALAALAGGVKPVTLGPRILRAETAALAALAVSLYQVGEMGGRV